MQIVNTKHFQFSVSVCFVEVTFFSVNKTLTKVNLGIKKNQTNKTPC